MPHTPVSAPRHDPLIDSQDSPTGELLRPARPSVLRASSPQVPEEGALATETAHASLDDILRALLAEPKLRHLFERLMRQR